MPAIAAWILYGLGVMIATWVGRLLLTFGLSIVVTEITVPSLMALLQQQTGGLPGTMLSLLAYWRLDDAFAVIVVAISLKRLSHAVSIGLRATNA